MADISVRLQGIDECSRALQALAPKLRQRALRNSLAAGARVYRDEARRLTPVLAVAVKRKGGALRRKPGTVRGAIAVRTSKQARRAGNVGVFVNVRPAKFSDRGANKPNDPFYWRWLEFGSRKMPAAGMLTRAARGAGAQALARITATLGPQVARLNSKGGALR